MRIGKGYDYLKEKAAQGNKSAQAEIDGIIQPESAFLWDAFLVLSKSRPPGFDGPSNIPISEILAWCEFNGIASPVIKDRVLSAVQALDTEFLAWGDRQRKNARDKR